MLNLDQSKYTKDGAFNDPVVRCDSCRKLLFRQDIQEHGACTCGHRRIRNVLTLKPEEMQMLKNRNVDPDFLALFEEVDRD